MSDHFRLNCFVDASFAGQWGYDSPNDPSSVRSRSGFVLTVGSAPVVWRAVLQSEVALSTMESEYIALSTAMRALLPARQLHLNLLYTFGLPSSNDSLVSTVFEDNQAALQLATTDPPRLTPRSKHFAIKYHWFREHLSQRPGGIQVKYISSAGQKADILTKALTPIKHNLARLQLMGW